MISSIYMCMRVAVRGIPLYSRNTARRHMCVYVCVYTKFQIRAISLGTGFLGCQALTFIYLFNKINI